MFDTFTPLSNEASREERDSWPDTDNGESWPIGLDLRDFIFNEGLPPGCYETDSPSALFGAELFGVFGAMVGQAAFFPSGFGATAEVKMPPLPKLDNPAGIRAYLTEAWRVIATAKGSIATADAAQAWARMKGLTTAATSQRAIADCIVAGPLPTTKGADGFYKLCAVLQGQVIAATKEAPIAAKAGTMAAAIAHAIAAAAKAKADAAKRAFASATKETKSTAAAAASAAIAEADKTRTAAVDAIKAVASIPGTVIQNITDAQRGVVDSVTSVPKSVVDSVTSVPKHVADRVEAIATSYLDAAREILPEIAAPVTKNLADAAKGAGMGIATVGIGVIALTVVGGGLALLIAFAPEIAAAAGAAGAGYAATRKK